MPGQTKLTSLQIPSHSHPNPSIWPICNTCTYRRERVPPSPHPVHLMSEQKRAKKVQTATRALPVRRHLIPNPETSRVQNNLQLPLNRRNRCNHVGRDLQKRSLDFCRSPTLAATPIPGSAQQALMFFFLKKYLPPFAHLKAGRQLDFLFSPLTFPSSSFNWRSTHHE